MRERGGGAGGGVTVREYGSQGVGRGGRQSEGEGGGVELMVIGVLDTSIVPTQSRTDSVHFRIRLS